LPRCCYEMFLFPTLQASRHYGTENGLRMKLFYTTDGFKKLNDNALVALALLVAESSLKQKDLMIKLIINLITYKQ